MLDATLRPWLDRCLNPIAAGLAKRGVGANSITVAGFVVGIAGAVALGLQAYGWALGLILCSRMMDGLDGAVARQSRPTDLGGYLDIVLDFIFYSAVVFGFAIGQPEQAVSAAFLIFSFVGTGSSFLAFAIFAAKYGLETRLRGNKSLYYLGGLTEGTETLAVLCAFCVWPSQFALLAWIFGAACWLTTVTRIWQACITLRHRDRQAY